MFLPSITRSPYPLSLTRIPNGLAPRIPGPSQRDPRLTSHCRVPNGLTPGYPRPIPVRFISSGPPRCFNVILPGYPVALADPRETQASRLGHAGVMQASNGRSALFSTENEKGPGGGDLEIANIAGILPQQAKSRLAGDPVPKNANLRSSIAGDESCKSLFFGDDEMEGRVIFAQPSPRPQMQSLLRLLFPASRSDCNQQQFCRDGRASCSENLTSAGLYLCFPYL